MEGKSCAYPTGEIRRLNVAEGFRPRRSAVGVQRRRRAGGDVAQVGNSIDEAEYGA